MLAPLSVGSRDVFPIPWALILLGSPLGLAYSVALIPLGVRWAWSTEKEPSDEKCLPDCNEEQYQHLHNDGEHPLLPV